MNGDPKLFEIPDDTEDYSGYSDADLVKTLKCYQGGKLEPLESEICRRLLSYKEQSGC